MGAFFLFSCVLALLVAGAPRHASRVAAAVGMGVIVIDGKPETVGDEYQSQIRLQVAVNKWHLFARNKDEDDATMQERVQGKLSKLRAVRPAAATPSQHANRG